MRQWAYERSSQLERELRRAAGTPLYLGDRSASVDARRQNKLADALRLSELPTAMIDPSLCAPFLRKLTAIAELGDDDLQEAASLCEKTEIAGKQRDIVSDGAPSKCIYILLKGWAARYNVLGNGDRRISGFLLPGDFCVHASVLGDMDHSIMALTECQIALPCADRISEMLARTPKLARTFWRSSLIDEAILRRWLVKAASGDAFETISHLLCELYERVRVADLLDGDGYEMPLTQKDFGDATGLTPVHVNRILRRIREHSLATVKGRRFSVQNLEGLRSAGGFDPSYMHLRRDQG